MSVYFGEDVVIYKPVPKFPGYQIGTDGSLWTCWRRWGKLGSYVMTDEWRQLKHYVNDNGYCVIGLYRDGECYDFRVHRLVMLVFVGPCPKGQEVRHKNRARQDNRLSNLSYGTRKDNMADAIAHGTTTRGEKNGHARFTDAQALEIKRAVCSGKARQLDMARIYNVSPSSISQLVNGKRWKHLGINGWLYGELMYQKIQRKR